MQSSVLNEELVLEEVRKDQFGDVIDSLKQYLPHSIHVQSSVSVLKHYGVATALGRKVFTPRHANYRDKMVVVTPVTTKRGVQSLQLFWSAKELQDEQVYCLLRSLPDFSWTQNFFVRQLPELLHDQLSRVVARLSRQRLQSSFITRLQIYTFPEPVPEPPSCPGPQYIVSKIRESDYDLILSHNPWSEFEDRTVMKTVYDKIPLVGIYKKSLPILEEEETLNATAMKSDGITSTYPVMELVSWSSLKHIGDLGNTFTVDAFRGKGLAPIVRLNIMKQMEALGLQPYAGAELDNVLSQKLLVRLGFTFQFVTYILKYTEPDGN